MTKVFAILGTALALTLLAMHSRASASEIVNADDVAAALQRGAIVWDMRSPEDYARGHIPGAVNLGAAATSLRNPNTEDFLDTATVAKLMNGAGIDLGKEIITYAHRGDVLPYWGLIAVRHFGGRKGEVFHGGLDDWSAAGKPVTSEPSRVPAVRRQFTVDPSVQINLPEVLAKLGDREVQIVDVRTPAEYKGDDIRALRGGHIPGARNIPYQQNWVDPDADVKLARGDAGARAGMALKSPPQLQAMYAGLDPNKETIVYCQSGARAAVTATVLRGMGFRTVRVFEESWLGYGNDLTAPAEDVQYFNIGALNGRLKSLEARVRRLEADIEAKRAAGR